MGFTETENEIYKEGAILGINEFIMDAQWPHDIICSKSGYICKFTYESLLDLTNGAPITAIKLVRRILRHQCYSYIYQKKLAERKSFEFF